MFNGLQRGWSGSGPGLLGAAFLGFHVCLFNLGKASGLGEAATACSSSPFKLSEQLDSGHQRHSRTLFPSKQGLHIFLKQGWLLVVMFLSFFLFYGLHVLFWFEFSILNSVLLWGGGEREGGNSLPDFLGDGGEAGEWRLGGRRFGDGALSLLCFWCFPGIFVLLIY